MLNIGNCLKYKDYEYIITEIIGRGANTVAYLAERKNNGLVTKCILKEYSPKDKENYETGKARFIASGNLQNSIRQNNILTNQTPPVSLIFEVNDTAYIDVSCYGGTTLSKLNSLSLPQYMEICRTIAKTVGFYHRSGFLCLDLKPENIFILQNEADDTITQLVEFIDFDSIRKTEEVLSGTVISYTKDWAAPEQHAPFTPASIGTKTDIYTIGELVFYILFGRHSLDKEHRGFSKYPFDEIKKEYRKYIERPDIRTLFTKLFRGTLRSSSENRFNYASEIIRILDRLIEELNKKDYIIPKLPNVSPCFLGRNHELSEISEKLKNNHVLFLTGIGGIGKSTIIRNYIQQKYSEYDIIAYLEYDGNLRHTFSDDKQFQISTINREDDENPDEYFERKLRSFKNICGEKRVLFVLDNYSGKINKDLSLIFDCNYDTVVVTRNEPPKNSFDSITVNPITDESTLFRLITLNLGRTMSKEENISFREIIKLVQGHTLTIELIARQIAAGKTDAEKALELIKENGFSRFSESEISNYKDGEEVYGTLSSIISALFSNAKLSENARTTLKLLSFLEVRGLETELVKDILKPDMEEIERLCKEGWLYADTLIRVHPVIAETIRNWSWGNTDDITVMECHKQTAEIYVGSRNAEQIKIILKNAETYMNEHPRHIVKAIYYDILGCYYDTINDDPARTYILGDDDPIDKTIEAVQLAIEELELSSDNRRFKYLAKNYLDLAIMLIRCALDVKDEVQNLLEKTKALLNANEPEYSENRCYFNMISAWYYTLIEPNIAKTLSFADRAKEIAYKVIPTELEIIDIIYIPTANCLAEHGDMPAAVKKLEEAIKICRKYPDMIGYNDKQKELEQILSNAYKYA